MSKTAKTTKHNNSLARTVMTLFMMLAMTLTASATDFITDVMVLGDDNKTSFYSQLSELTAQGWIDINYDLNESCGAGTDYIHLLYKKQSSSGNTGVPITDFYIRTGKYPPGSLTHGGRTYYLVPYDGSDDFIDSEGDLNNHAGGDYIHLYYTKDALANSHGVTGITFNTTQSGAVGANGGGTGYDLNEGCGSQSAYVYMHIATTSGANVVTLSSGSGNVQLQNGHILTGTGGEDTRVTITDGATVTLNGVNITAIANDYNHMWPGINCLGNAVIVLGGGTTNTIRGGDNSSGIYVPENETLTIQGSGTLNVTGGSNGAGIGSNFIQSSCGNITINSGTVNAAGGNYAAGIGSSHGSNSSCGNITINGGSVTATGGTRGAGIGSGEYKSSCGSIFINGGTVTATGGENAAGIGSGFNNSSCGSISITQGVTRVTATKGSGCNNAIGAGYNSSCQSVTIGGVETGSITQSPFTTFPYTVAFNANGGTGTMTNMNFMYNVAQNLTANAFTNGGRQFLGWATSANGQKVYNDGQSVSNLTQTAGATVTLYAKWANTVTLTQQIGEVLLQNGETLTGTGGQNTRVKIADGATVTFSGVNITAIVDDEDHIWPGINCLGNAVIVLGGGTTNTINGGYYSSGIYVPENKTLTIQGSGTLNATGGKHGAGIGGGRKSSCGNITISGGSVTATGDFGTAGIGSGYYQSSCGNITINGGTVTANGGDYSAGIGSGRNYSPCGSISITQGVTRVTATKGYNCDNAIGASINSSCQSVTIGGVETGSITQSPFTTFPYTVAFNANGGTGTMANQVFMYNVAQPLSANSFTCTGYTKDGWATTLNGPKVYNDGQSVTNLTETTVTLYARWNALKAIAGYGESTTSGWNLIALPIEGSIAAEAVGNIFSAAEYDLYRFNQNAEQEWENWKSHANNDDHYHFNLESGRGYLYASQAYTTLVFCGTPYSGNGQVTLHKTDGARLGGWNLIGNPFITSKTIGGKPFYRMNELGTEIIAAANPTIAAMEGIFVVANTNGETITFADPTRGRESEERIIINLCNNNTAVIDRAIVRLGEGEALPKMQIRDNNTKIYLSQGGKDYAIANAETTGEIPISFKPSENGTYIISVNPEGMEMDYLHLIDNLTGMDVNLLASPSYTFNAKTTDYASRFKLVFSANGNADSEEVPFAFLSNGNIIVNGDGIVQVIDMMGQIIVQRRDGACTVSTDAMAPGVYVLRLINGDKVKTQKIVIQ